MRIDIYSGFDLEDMIFDFISLKAERKFRGSGSFELVLSNLEYATSLVEDNVIAIGDKAYIIENYLKYKNSNNELRFEISGHDLCILLDRRVVVTEVINTDETIEEQIYSIISKHCISPSDSERTIPGMVNAQTKGFPEKPNETLTIKNKSVLDAVSELAVMADLGFKVVFDIDHNQFIFELYRGLDRSDEVFFTEEYFNVANTELTKVSETYKNVIYLDNSGSLTQYGSASGIERREHIVFGDDLLYAINELEERKKIISANTQVLLTEQFIYREDWDLGDKVTFRDKTIGFVVEKPILEIVELYSDSLEIEVVFGGQMPRLIDVIKNKKGR